MATRPLPPATPGDPPAGELATTLATLAGTADEAPGLDDMLVRIARLAADLVEPVSYASITAHRAGAPTTVAASSQVAIAVDVAQYGDQRGPCLDALARSTPTDVTDVAAVMSWPGFRDMAWRLGLRASLSIPLFAAAGGPVAALNLYAHDPEPMAALIRHVWAVYDVGSSFTHPRSNSVEEGSEQLLSGLTAAFRVRDLIQQALGVIMGAQHLSPEAAYRLLSTTAATTGASVLDTAIMAIRLQHL